MPHLDEGTLQEWIDRDRSGLVDAEARAVEAHLAGCEVCVARLDAIREIDDRARGILARGSPEDVPIPGFEAVVSREAVQRGNENDGQRGRGDWRRYAWAATLLLALGVGWMGNELIQGPRNASAPDSVALEPTAVAFSGDGAAEPDRTEQSEPEVPGANPDVPGSSDDGPLPPPVAEAPATSLGGAGVDADAAGAAFDETLGGRQPPAVPESQTAALATADRTLPLARAAEELTWTAVNREEAAERLGLPVLVVPGLELLGTEVAESKDPPWVRVHHALPDGREMTLYQVPVLGDSAALTGDGSVGDEPGASMQRGGLHLEASGDLPVDSLRTLLQRAR